MNWTDVSQPNLLEMNRILDQLKVYHEETFWHCHRVGARARELAAYVGFDVYDQQLALFSGLLHDIGKLKIPLAILDKPGKLTEAEMAEMEKHAFYSAELIETFSGDEFFKQVQEVVLHHHERVDGSGYPFQLEEAEIPLLSKVILVVDTVDAMTVRRAYREGLSMDVVYKELKKFSRTQFDPWLAEAFIDMDLAQKSKIKAAPVLQLFAKQKHKVA